MLPEPIRLLQRGARQRGDADRQRALVEVRQEGLAGEAKQPGSHQQAQRCRRHALPARHGGVQPRR
jgi:hypothetical protein